MVFRSCVWCVCVVCKDSAMCVQISDRSLSNKLQGRSDFTWSEVSKIRDTFFPDMQKDDLFKVADGERKEG